jgi:hypothetical protein
MKIIFALALTFLSLHGLASDKDAILYNDKIINEQNKITKKILELFKTPDEATLALVRKQIDESIEVLHKMKPYKGDEALLPSAKALFEFYRSIADNEYKSLLRLFMDKDKYTEDQLTLKVTEYLNAISQKEKPLDENFNAAQKAFAKKYGFVLMKNEMQDELNEAVENK